MAAKKQAAKGWYQKGGEGKERSEKVDAEAKARREQKGPMRFWLEAETSAKLTFLDTPDFFFYEHNLKLNGKYFNFFTCLRDIDTCPLCEAGDNASYCVAASAIVHKPYTDKDGNVHKNQKMLFVAKGKARQLILRQIERRDGSLKFAAYEMTRGGGQNECATGEDVEFLKKLPKEGLMSLKPEGAETWLEPFEYATVFAPKPAEELRRLVGGKSPVGSESEERGGEPDEDEDKGKKNGHKKKDGDDSNGGDINSIDDLL